MELRHGDFRSQVFQDSFKLRVRVFKEEQSFQESIDHWDRSSDHVVLYEGTQPIATARIIPIEENVSKIGRFCVEKEFRKKGAGRLLMEEIETAARQGKIAKLTLGAQKQAQPFYEKLGFSPYGDLYYEEGSPHIFMEKWLDPMKEEVKK